MNVKSWAFAALAASVVLGATGCGSSSTPQAASRTPIPSAAPAAPGASAPAQPGDTDRPGTPPQAHTNAPETESAPPPASVPVDQKEPAPAPPPPANQPPNGSGHGLCFDSNSQLAQNAIARLKPTPYPDAPWVVLEASNDPISAGCSGVLSWMLVDWNGSHPGYHVLFFTNGTYLGTATSKYYSYTTVLGKTKNTVSVQYRWALPQDALCCPSGGPTTVTYTLNGTTVTAQGQFPPDPDK